MCIKLFYTTIYVIPEYIWSACKIQEYTRAQTEYIVISSKYHNTEGWFIRVTKLKIIDYFSSFSVCKFYDFLFICKN